jgi:DNA-binding transcriptional ArsR family regulator
MTEKYISIDLNDPRMKDLSEILSNKSCKKILNLLAENEWTETEIARELKMPLNSVDYNIKKLAQAGLIESSNHWWSVRGKKMHAYKVSDKKIIISPKKILSSFIIPVATTAIVAILGARKFFNSTIERNLIQNFVNAPAKDLATNEISLRSADATASAMGAAPELAQNASFFASLAGWEWLILGIWLGSILFFVLNYVLEMRSKWKNQ